MEENSFLQLITPNGDQRIIVYDNNFPSGMVGNRLNIRIPNSAALNMILRFSDIFKEYIKIHDFDEDTYTLIDRTTGETLDWHNMDDFDSTHVYEIRSNRNRRRSYRFKSSVRKSARKARISKKKSVKKSKTRTSKRKSARRISKRKSRGKYRR